MRTGRDAADQRTAGTAQEAKLVLALAAGTLVVAASIVGGGIAHLVEQAHGIFRALP